jgi:hypothetical protein
MAIAVLPTPLPLIWPPCQSNKETEARVPASTFLKVRINDVITFGDDSELRIQALTLRGRAEGLAFEAYYGLLPATSNI